MKRTTTVEKIKAIVADKSAVVSAYTVTDDDSTQAELRLAVTWSIRYPVDAISYPRRMDKSAPWAESPWAKMADVEQAIADAALLAHGEHRETLSASSRTKSGAAAREAADAAARDRWASEFLAAHKIATRKRPLAAARATVASLQAWQKRIVAEMRAENSRHHHATRAAARERAEADIAAIAEGRFWDASPEAIKAHFSPPFYKNRLAGVSSAWRAALFLECVSTGYKSGREWRHRLVGTGRAYLCGIDDNGDEWGHQVAIALPLDDHMQAIPEADIEDAMAELFDAPRHSMHLCTRQGDLLFRPAEIPGERYECEGCGLLRGYGCTCPATTSVPIGTRRIPAVELHPQDGPWDVRESHRIEADGLERNGRFFRAQGPITVSHTSHAPVTLPAGSYRLHTLQVADAD